MKLSFNTSAIVDIENLQYFYGRGDLRRQVLHSINLRVLPGEIIIMTGPSGSGKTTLLSLIGGLRSVTYGSFKFLGREMKGADESRRTHYRRHIGYIFQHYNLLPFLTAEQNIRLALKLQPETTPSQLRTKPREALHSVGLDGFAEYYPGRLSGGQKQRVSIARALVAEPKLIIADEPTAALDSKTGRDVVNLMRRASREQNRAIIIVTHDNRILDIADRHYRMEDGYLQEC
jgi:putative ABC transport system ATP-binding protein